MASADVQTPVVQTPGPAVPAAAAPSANVAVRSSASLYVGDLRAEVTENMLYEHFKQIGPIISIRVCRDAATMRSLGYAYVNFQNSTDADRAIQILNYSAINGRACRIMVSRRDPSQRRSGAGNVFIKHLDKSIDNKSLYDLFSSFGNILSSKIACEEDGTSKGFGYVHFSTQEEADTAIANLNQKYLNEKQVFVGPYERKPNGPSKTTYTNLYIKNLDETVDEAQLIAFFEAVGPLKANPAGFSGKSVLIARDENKKSKGFGFADFEKHEDAVAAVENLNKKSLGTKPVEVARALKKAERQAQLTKQYEARKNEILKKNANVNLYVKNLDYDVDDARLAEAFASFGSITSSKVMRDQSGNSKGFGFVCFSSPEEANAALAMDKKPIGTKPVSVNFFMRKEQRQAMLQQQWAERMTMAGAFPASAGMYPIFYGAAPQFPGGFGFPNAGPRQAMGPRGPFIPGRFPPQMAGFQGMPRGGQMRMPGQGPNMYRAPRPAGAAAVPAGAKPTGAPRAAAPRPAGAAAAAGAKIVPGARNIQTPQGAAAPAASQSSTVDEEFTAHLASLPEEERRNVLGERLFPLITARVGEEKAPKITGMLLELDSSELLNLLQSADTLSEAVVQANHMLEQHVQ